MASKPSRMSRVAQIAHEHILYARRYPQRLVEIANRMRITTDTALSVCIADQVCEEFSLHSRES